MRHLVFTAKTIGFRCVDYLLNAFPEDDYTIVVCEPDSSIISRMLDDRQHEYMPLEKMTLDKVRNVPERHYDWLLNLWGGYIFTKEIISRCHRTMNIHPAYLPYCRGRDPVVWAIRYGFRTGVTLHSITEGVDEGPIWYQEQLTYELPIRGVDLYNMVVTRCWKAFCEQWPRLRSGEVAAVAQPDLETGYTFRRRDLWVDRRIDIDSDDAARDVILRLLAHDFAPNYSAQVVVGGRVYNATLCLEPA